MAEQKTIEARKLLVNVLDPKELMEYLEVNGNNDVLLISDGRTEEEKTPEEYRSLREEAADQIRQIPALRAQFTPFRGEKIPLAEAYYMVLVGDARVRNLRYAINTLVQMLKDQRVPQKYKGERGVKGGRFPIRLAIQAALEEQAREFERNLARVPGLIDRFYAARDAGNLEAMQNLYDNHLAKPYYRGPLAAHFECDQESDLRPWFESLRLEMEAIEKARQ